MRQKNELCVDRIRYLLDVFKSVSFFLRCPQFTMLNCPTLLFGIVCTQQSCTLLEYCTRLTYSKVFHFFEMCYAWYFALLSCSFPQFTMINCSTPVLEIVHSQQSCTLLEYCSRLTYSKVTHLFLMCFYKLLSIYIN